MPRNTQNSNSVYDTEDRAASEELESSIRRGYDAPMQPAYYAGEPTRGSEGSTVGRSPFTITYLDTGDIELNAINVIKEALMYLETRQKVRVLRYMLDRSDNQSTQLEDMPF